MGDALTLDTYVIARPNKFGFNLPYDCYDKDGNKLFDIKKKLIGEEYSIADASGKVLGTMHRKMLALTATYDLYDGDKTLLGRAIKEMVILPSGGGTFALQDASGDKIALAKLNFPLLSLLEGKLENLGYDITSPDGTKAIATIAILFPGVAYTGSVLSMEIAKQNARFVLEIQDKSINPLVLIEFTIAVDHIYHSQQNNMGNPGFGNMGGVGFGQPPGFGGSGINFKL